MSDHRLDGMSVANGSRLVHCAFRNAKVRGGVWVEVSSRVSTSAVSSTAGTSMATGRRARHRRRSAACSIMGCTWTRHPQNAVRQPFDDGWRGSGDLVCDQSSRPSPHGLRCTSCSPLRDEQRELSIQGRRGFGYDRRGSRRTSSTRCAVSPRTAGATHDHIAVAQSCPPVAVGRQTLSRENVDGPAGPLRRGKQRPIPV